LALNSNQICVIRSSLKNAASQWPVSGDVGFKIAGFMDYAVHILKTVQESRI
jgi:hypothetical protein